MSHRVASAASVLLLCTLLALPGRAQTPPGPRDSPGRPAAEAAELRWPDSELSRRVQGWFAQLKGSEAEARAFFASQLAPSALAEVGVDGRMERRRGMLERTAGLTPLEVTQSGESHMEVRTRAGNGDEPTAIIEAEGAPPHRILSVRLELGAGGDGPPPGMKGAPPSSGGEGSPPGAESGGARMQRRPSPPAGPPLSDAEAVAQIRATLDAAAKRGEFSGAVLFARDGVAQLRQAWGLADRERKLPLTPQSRFNIASIGKIVTRVALAQLAQAGKLSLDDKLSKYLPDFPRANDITLRMLAEHRSGVGDIFGPRYEAMDKSKLRSNHDFVELIRDQPMWFEPDTQQRYSNGGYVLLGEVVEKASGMEYFDYLSRHVFVPAGLSHTAALREGDGTPGVARGYTHEGAGGGAEVDNVATRPARGSAAGGSYSTLDDLLAFERAILGGKLCDAGWAQWVVNGSRPKPDSTPRAGALQGVGFVFAGGAPGINSVWHHEGRLTLILMSNRDPEVVRATDEALGDILRRVKQ